MCFTQAFLQSVLPTASIIAGKLPDGGRFSVDSRTLQPDQIFIAIEGKRVDGHTFVVDALAKGAGVMMAYKHKSLVDSLLSKFPNKCVILVEDPLAALIELARAWRKQLTAEFVGITGSLGKTSTKEYTAAFLRAGGKKCFASQGNQNTLIGISLNLLQMDTSYEVGIFELGIGARSEMVALVDLLRPTTAVITYVGHSHLEGLGSIADVAAEKRKIFSLFASHNIGIINGDQEVLNHVGYPFPVIRFGRKTTNQIQARRVKVESGCIKFVLKLYGSKYDITLDHTHQGMINNVLAAISVAFLLGVNQAIIVTTIGKLPRTAQRFEVCPLKDKKGIMIDDCYNASPESVRAALTAFEAMSCSGKKIAILGDMLELGRDSYFLHRQVGRFLKNSRSIEHIILVGPNMKVVKETAPYGIFLETVDSWQEAVERLQLVLENESAILVKGSRGMHLQNLVSAFAYKEQVTTNV